MNITPNIPLDLCIYAIQNKCINQFQTYIFLKYNCDGYLRNPMELVKKYMIETGKSERTFFNHRKWLISNGWLIEMKKGGVRVLGYRPLLKHLGYDSVKSKGALLECALTDFRAFVSAVVVTYVGRVKKYIDKRTGNKNKGIASRRFVGAFSCPLTYLATTLNISKSTAQNIRNDASKLLRIEPVFCLLDRIQPEHMISHSKYGDNDHCKLVVKNGKVYEQLNSAIWSDIVIKRYRF